MKQVKYHSHLNQDLYDIIDETTEGILIEYLDDYNNTTLKIERKTREDYYDGNISE